MANKPISFQFYTDKWLAGTLGMSKTEKGIFIDLMAHQFDMNGLPNDLEEIERLIKPKGNKERESLAYVLRKFPIDEDGRLRNKKLVSVIKEYEYFREVQSNNGSKGGRPKKTKPEETQDAENNKPDETQTKPNNKATSTITITKEVEVDEDARKRRNEEFKKEILADTLLAETCIMSYHLQSVEEFTGAVEDFFKKKRAVDDDLTWRDYSDCKKNLVYWIPSYKTRKESENGKSNSKSKRVAGRITEADAREFIAGR